MLIQLSPVATATPLCRYEVFSPNVLVQGIVHQLAEAGLSAPVEGTRSTRDRQEHPIFRAPSSMVGVLVYERDLISRAASVSAMTSDGSPLVLAEERIYPCPVHDPNQTCWETSVYTAFAGGQPEGTAAFAVKDGEYGLEFFRFGEKVRSFQWQHEFASLLDWLVQYYAESADVQTVALRSPFAAIEFAITADPMLAPYRDHIQVSRGADGRIVVHGRLSSNAQHSMLLQKFFDLGIWNVQSWVVIDTGFVVPFQKLQPAIESCL